MRRFAFIGESIGPCRFPAHVAQGPLTLLYTAVYDDRLQQDD
jgi:hypothetical protein